MPRPQKFERIKPAVDWIFAQLGRNVYLATPLGLGKPNPLLNEIYIRAKANREIRLKIFTALSLAVPSAGNDLQRRFLEPFAERQWGKDYPHLAYLADLETRTLPENIRVHEFYLQAGKSLHRAEVQRDYVSVNYTHAQYAILDHDINVIVQMVAKKEGKPGYYSFSCNPDLTCDVVDFYKKSGRNIMVVGMIHPHLPYCGADAEVSEDFFDMIVDSPEVNHQLFALPRQPVADADFLIGLHASLLIEDGGTLQIGIGSLAEALVYCTLLRQRNGDAYREITSKLLAARPYVKRHEKFHNGPFHSGLYGTSEMVNDGFMHLHRGGVLKREVFELEKSVRRYLHGAFYLGSKEFYEWVRERDRVRDEGFCMTRVSKVNDLYDENELAIRRQRVKARFFNTCMSVSLLGGAASDTTEDGLVVSGVGGQYNFVAMSHELPDSISALMLRSARHAHKKLESNFRWDQGQQTIPRHLRDVVISEFGVAFLKNRTDQEVIQAQLMIANSQFQESLRETAVKNLKLDPRWRLPDWARGNREAWPSEFLSTYKAQGLFPTFPFGSDFTPQEEHLARALLTLKISLSSKAKLLKIFWRGLQTPSEKFLPELERMQLARAKSVKEKAYKILLLGALGV